MKIQSNKNNNNINEESINSLKDFRRKQILTNIKFHKIFILLLLIINIGLTTFVIFYKNKIHNLKKSTNSYHTQLDSEDESLSNINSDLMHKLLNMQALNEYGLIRFSFLFEKSDEFKTIQNIIYDYRKDIEKVEIPEQFRHTYLLFQGLMDNNDDFIDKVAYFANVAIFIETYEDKKFGIFTSDIIIIDKNKEYISNTKQIFLYSFETKKKYDYIGKEKGGLKFNINDKMIIVGDDEIIIDKDFYSNGGIFNFPLKSFDVSTINRNVFTGENGKFSVKNIEVYCFSQYQYNL